MEEIYFITVNYNDSQHTINYVGSINKLIISKEKINIIIVDNNSKSDDFSILNSRFKHEKNIILIRNKNNLGYFKALNVGIGRVKHKRGKIFVVSNNDIQFDKNFLIQLANIQYSKDTLIISPNVITKNGIHQNPHYITRVSKTRKLMYNFYFKNYYLGQIIYFFAQIYKKIFLPRNKNNYNKYLHIYMGIGACYIIKDIFFEYYKKLDDRVFLWGEEALLANQVKQVNGKILYAPNLIVYHAESGSVKKIPSKLQYNITKDSYKIYKKYL